MGRSARTWGADPRKNAWSGIHTRLGAEIMHRGRPVVDGLIIWDMMCGTIGSALVPRRRADPKRLIHLPNGKGTPPPCLYLFPRTIPDPRGNPAPKCWELKDITFMHALWRAFKARPTDVTEVRIEAQMDGAEIQRRTRLVRAGKEVLLSEWTTLNRARR